MLLYQRFGVSPCKKRGVQTLQKNLKLERIQEMFTKEKDQKILRAKADGYVNECTQKLMLLDKAFVAHRLAEQELNIIILYYAIKDLKHQEITMDELEKLASKATTIEGAYRLMGKYGLVEEV